MAMPPNETTRFVRKSKTGGGRVYINADVINKALELAGMDINCPNLHVKAHAAKDGKRAKIMLYLFCK